MATPNDKRTPAQQRAAEMREEAQRSEGRRRMTVIVAVVVVALGVIGGIVAIALNKKSPAAGTPAAKASSFAAPTDVKAAVKSAGIDLLPQEIVTYHVHSHLQVSDNGKDVVVPAAIGIMPDKSGISPLHTHAEDGVVHIEAATKTDFTLGQFFKEWQTTLSSTCVGNLCADGSHELKAYVDGQPFAGDPATIPLGDHTNITIAYLDKGKAFTPATFDFASAGE